jgi:hypothetical protein
MNLYGDFLTAIRTWESLLTRDDADHGPRRFGILLQGGTPLERIESERAYSNQ